MRVSSASLDPDSFRHDLPDNLSGQIQICQTNHPYQVRNITELHVPCACGRPLCGVEFEMLHNAQGYALHFFGVCLTCGRQSGIYMGALPETEAEHSARLRNDIEAMVRAVHECREGTAMEPNETETEAA